MTDKGPTTGANNVVLYTENETGITVKVEVLHRLKPHPQWCSVEYPSPDAHPDLPGRKFGMPMEEMIRHFTIVNPQEIFFNAFGIHDRPTQKQKELIIAEMFKD